MDYSDHSMLPPRCTDGAMILQWNHDKPIKYADWLPQSKKRHTQYVKALISSKVSTVLGKFKQKDRKCPKCKHKWYVREERNGCKHRSCYARFGL